MFMSIPSFMPFLCPKVTIKASTRCKRHAGQMLKNHNKNTTKNREERKCGAHGRAVTPFASTYCWKVRKGPVKIRRNMVQVVSRGEPERSILGASLSLSSYNNDHVKEADCFFSSVSSAVASG